jgi:hypothetical protein
VTKYLDHPQPVVRQEAASAFVKLMSKDSSSKNYVFWTNNEIMALNKLVAAAVADPGN